MAKAAEAIAPVGTPGTKPFDHGGRFVTVLIPQNSKHEDYVRGQFEERFEDPPILSKALKVAEISQDTILYVAHPIRVKRKSKDRSGRDVWKKAVDLHISGPIDVGAECTTSPRRGAKIVDFSLIVQAMMRDTKNDPAGWFFAPFLSGFHKADFTEATIQLVNR